MLILLAACQSTGNSSFPPSSTTLYTAAPSKNSMATAMFSPSPAPALTNIVIDGSAKDWIGRATLFEDPLGDSEPGAIDFTRGMAFVNQDALYFYIEVSDPNASFILFDMHFSADEKRLQLGWTPGQEYGRVVDWTTEKPADVGPVKNSTFALGAGLEGRVDLRDLGSPAKAGIAFIMAMVDPGNDWHAADSYAPKNLPPTVNEKDKPIISSLEEPYVLARAFNLSEGYLATRLFPPPAPDLNGIARSESGVFYVQHWGLSAGISTLDPDTGVTTRILEIPQGIGSSWITGGPGDTAIISIGTEIWILSPDGSRTLWGVNNNATPILYTQDGRLLGRTADSTRVVQINPGGDFTEIGSGFTHIFDLAIDLDGVIYVSEWSDKGEIVRLLPNGAKRVLAPNVVPNDFNFLEVSPDGELFSAVASGIYKVDTQNGKRTLVNLSKCATTLGGPLAFVSPEKLLFVDATSSQIFWVDPKANQEGVLTSNNGSFTNALAIGPDGQLYGGVSGCGPGLPSKIIRFANDGTSETFVGGLPARIRSIAFAHDGTLFIGIIDVETSKLANRNRLFYLPPGGSSPVEIIDPNLPEIMSLAVDPSSGRLLVNEPNGTIRSYDQNGFQNEYKISFPKPIATSRISFGNDGELFALATATMTPSQPTERWVFKLDLSNGKSTILAELHHKIPTLDFNPMVGDFQGNVWVSIGVEYLTPQTNSYNPNNHIYKITPNGDLILFARNLPIDALSIAVSQSGDVYFSCGGGIFRIYKE